MQRQIRGESETWQFLDYKTVDGLTIARTVESSQKGMKERWAITLQELLTAYPAELYKPVSELPKDTTFDPKMPSRVELKKLSSGHVFLRPKVDGQDGGWFALDTGTGAGMAILPDAADRLQMPAFGKVARGGAGSTTSFGSLRKGKTFEIGPITIANSVYLELPMEFKQVMKQAFDIEVAGTCGYDLFRRSVVELDLKKSVANIYSPGAYELRGGKWCDIALLHRIPSVKCKFDGDRTGRFRLDTGATDSVILHSPAVKSMKLLVNRQTTKIPVGGVEGSIDAESGKLVWFSAAGVRKENVPALFITGDGGALSDPYTAGTFGAAVFDSRKIVFDYPNRRLALIE
jgi:hypothetical protein